VLLTLSDWCEELLRAAEEQVGSNSGFDAKSPASLKDKLRRYISATRERAESSFWPLVKRVRVGLDDKLIVKYATFVDCPGIDDKNKMRALAFEDHIRDCDQLWIVARID
jgi:hypothetical protein